MTREEPTRFDRMLAAIEAWGARRVDGMNPVFVRDMRRVLKGKLYPLFLLLVIVCGTVASILIAISSSGIDANDGERLASLILRGVVVSFLGLHPIITFNSFRTDNTPERMVDYQLIPLESATMVTGKLRVGTALMALEASVYGVFLVFASLLHGVDPILIGFTFALISCCAVGLQNLAAFFGHWRVGPFASAILLALGCGPGLLLAVAAVVRSDLVRNWHLHYERIDLFACSFVCALPLGFFGVVARLTLGINFASAPDIYFAQTLGSAASDRNDEPILLTPVSRGASPEASDSPTRDSR